MRHSIYIICLTSVSTRCTYVCIETLMSEKRFVLNFANETYKTSDSYLIKKKAAVNTKPKNYNLEIDLFGIINLNLLLICVVFKTISFDCQM